MRQLPKNIWHFKSIFQIKNPDPRNLALNVTPSPQQILLEMTIALHLRTQPFMVPFNEPSPKTALNNNRGPVKVSEQFIRENNLKMVIRSHEAARGVHGVYFSFRESIRFRANRDVPFRAHIGHLRVAIAMERPYKDFRIGSRSGPGFRAFGYLPGIHLKT